MDQYKKSIETVKATKIMKSCHLEISTRSTQRYFKSEGYRYTRTKSEIQKTQGNNIEDDYKLDHNKPSMELKMILIGWPR